MRNDGDIDEANKSKLVDSGPTYVVKEPSANSRRVSDGFAKLQEEVLELKEVIAQGNDDEKRERLEDEIGDMLFVIVNIARFLRIDSESALKRANRKFKTRFQFIEAALERQGKSLEETSLEEMEELWRQAKLELPAS